MKKEFALVIGRFQPFCNNHLELLHWIVKKYQPKKILLGVGGNGKFDERHFLKFDEVKQMISPVLDEIKIEIEMKEIPDINNPPKYGKYVETFFEGMNENNTIVFTDNPYTGDCFDKHGNNYEVVCPKITSEIRATQVRQRIINHQEWEQMVPKPIFDYILKNELARRLADNDR